MSDETALKELPALRESLSRVSTQYLYEARHIGSAIAYLVMLEDLLKEKQKDEQP
jgi:hypothetical protein